MSYQFQDVQFEIKDRIAHLHMNRPDLLNALTDEMRVDYQAMLDQIQGNPEVGALIISGEGRAFSAGGNVKGMSERLDTGIDGYAMRLRLNRLHEWLQRLHDLDCPVIAAVDGLAYGGGLSVALLADFVLATPRSKFCAVFARIGLVPDMAMLYTLPRAVGMQKAKELMYTGRSFDADEAMDMGLLYSLHAPEDLQSAAQELATRLAQGSKEAIAMTKKLTNASFQNDYQTMAGFEADVQALAMATDFHEDAVRRFIAKEEPRYDWDRMDRAKTEPKS